MSTVPRDLAEQRRRMGISLEAVAEATKISLHFLGAIEAEEFDKLPGGIFNTSYIRQYAAFTCVDELSILARYSEFISSAESVGVPPKSGVSRLIQALRRTLAIWGQYHPAAVDGKAAAPPQPEMQHRILIVDDELSIRQLLRTLFEEAGYQVMDAADGQEVIRLATSRRKIRFREKRCLGERVRWADDTRKGPSGEPMGRRRMVRSQSLVNRRSLPCG